mmetsp:Transcript_76735/g.136014  ORF Transcript_76735/g.136014 Transcript_76735/m.136014 type:complete len:110 (-) Transcript_76735:1024-1353(-)
MTELCPRSKTMSSKLIIQNTHVQGRPKNHAGMRHQMNYTNWQAKEKIELSCCSSALPCFSNVCGQAGMIKGSSSMAMPNQLRQCQCWVSMSPMSLKYLSMCQIFIAIYV